MLTHLLEEVLPHFHPQAVVQQTTQQAAIILQRPQVIVTRVLKAICDVGHFVLAAAAACAFRPGLSVADNRSASTPDQGLQKGRSASPGAPVCGRGGSG